MDKIIVRGRTTNCNLNIVSKVKPNYELEFELSPPSQEEIIKADGKEILIKGLLNNNGGNVMTRDGYSINVDTIIAILPPPQQFPKQSPISACCSASVKSHTIYTCEACGQGCKLVECKGMEELEGKIEDLIIENIFIMNEEICKWNGNCPICGQACEKAAKPEPKKEIEELDLSTFCVSDTIDKAEKMVILYKLNEIIRNSNER